MKRITTIICILTALLVGTVYAETVSEDYATGEVTVSGKVNPYEIVGLQILTGSIDDFCGTTEKGGMVAYIDQTEADADGIYTFKLRPKLESGVYSAYISAGSIDWYRIEEIEYVNSGEYDDFIKELNAAASFEEFYQLINDKKMLFGKETNTLAEGEPYQNAMRALYEYVKNTPLSDNGEYSSKRIYNSYVVMYAYNAGKKINVIDYIDTVCVPDDLDEWLDKIAERSDKSKYFETKLKKCSFTNIAEFEDAITEAAILTTVKYSSGYADTKKIAEQYKNFIGAPSATNAVYKKVSGKDYTMGELKSALTGRPSTGDSSGGGGGSGGGSTGGGTTGGSGGSKTTMPAKQQMTVDTGLTKNDVPDKIVLPFTDIDSVWWAGEAITALYDRKLINGSGENKFNPNDFITREEFVKIVVSAMGLSLDNDKSVFADVSDEAWYKPFVNAAYKAGVISGAGDNIFGSGENIKRQDMAKILYSVTGISKQENEKSFNDADLIDDYALDAVKALSGVGIIQGNENNEFLPNEYSTRAEAVCVIYRSLEYLK